MDIIFDGPPGPESGRFVEVEDGNGKSIKAGEWEQRGEFWVLVIPSQAAKIAALEADLGDWKDAAKYHLRDATALHAQAAAMRTAVKDALAFAEELEDEAHEKNAGADQTDAEFDFNRGQKTTAKRIRRQLGVALSTSEPEVPE